MAEETPDALADALRAIAYEARLELVALLREPRALPELRIEPRRRPGGSNRAGGSARQTVQAHLDKLVEAGLVRVESAAKEDRVRQRYVLHPPKLYALAEGLRGLLPSPPPPAHAPRGPALVLVRGLGEGTVFPLDPARAGPEGWVVGRDRGVAIPLDYDPFVSREHALVRRVGDGFEVLDLPASKNGTTVNWAPIGKDRPASIVCGDVVGVGRSLLLLRA